jgi:hypothetical protein
MRVLAVDPGGATGLALWEKTPGGESIQQWQIDSQMGLLATVEAELARGLDVLVCESFQLSRSSKKSTAGSLQTIETIGALRWLAHKESRLFVLQSPSDAKTFVTDDKVNALNWWKVGEEHARSATRHLILYLTKSRLIDPERLILR